MRVPRIYVEAPLAEGALIPIDGESASRLARVLRLRSGDHVTLFNGQGGEWEGVVSSARLARVEVRIDAHRSIERESPLSITLVQGISRGERMDYTVQKAVELGIAAIVPVLTAHSVVELGMERRARRIAHWQRIVTHACEQCGRNRVPGVAPVARLDEWLAKPAAGLKLILWREGALVASDLPEPPGAVTLLVGPEGGFEREEVSAARAAGYQPLRLGPRTLRTETAALAVLAMLQGLWGDLR